MFNNPLFLLMSYLMGFYDYWAFSEESFIFLVSQLLLLISIWKLYKREWNSAVTICSKCCGSSFLRNITGWDYILGNWFKIKFPEIWLYFNLTVFPWITFIDKEHSKNRILFWSLRHDHGRFEVNLFLICFIKRTKLQETFINTSALPK